MATTNALFSRDKTPSARILSPIAWFKQWLEPYTTDPTIAFRERTIRGLIPIFAVFFGILMFAPQTRGAESSAVGPIIPSPVFYGLVYSLLIGATTAVRNMRVTLAGVCLMVIMALAMLMTASSFGADSPAVGSSLYIMSVLAAITLPFRLAGIAVALMVGAIGVVGHLESAALQQSLNSVSPSLTRSLGFQGVVSLILMSMYQYLKREHDIRLHEVEELATSLEQRVQERTRDLQVAADISLQITTQLDPAQLLADIVKRTATAFNLYHVSIFLYDEKVQILKLKQGVGDAGDQMVAMGKQFRLTDKGLVPAAARAQQESLSNDVLADPNHAPNPLLPLTRSELAIPMIYRDALIGVLDIQSEQVNRFSDEDLRILRTLSEQIAIAVRNSQLFQDTKAAREEAEKANTVKSAFLASMSHELRTPLNAIINFSKFLKKGVPGPVNAEQEQLIGSIADSGQHLLNLINDVLDMSKIEAGSLKLYVETEIDLRPIIETAIEYTRPLLADKPVEMQQDVPGDLPRLTGDRKRLLQIFLNILSNACRFTEAGYVKVHAECRADRLLVSINDTGPGIAPEDAGYVFTAFKQTESGLRQGGGTGLGMPICQKLVEAHGGSIWFESQVGAGTTFFVELPLQTDLQPERSRHHV